MINTQFSNFFQCWRVAVGRREVPVSGGFSVRVCHSVRQMKASATRRLGLLICGGVTLGASLFAGEPAYYSPLALVPSRDAKTLYVIETTARKLALVGLASGKVTATVALPAEPTGLAMAPDGARLYISAGVADGRVLVVDLPAGKIADAIPAGHTPMAPQVSPDGKTLYLCNRFNNDVAIIDLVSKKTTAHIAVRREPVAAVLTQDGKTLFVANHLPNGEANVDRMTSVIEVIDTATAKVVGNIALPNGAIDLRGMCLSSDGKLVYVPSIFAHFMVPTTQIERGWMNTHALNLIDTEKRKLRYTVLLDDVDLGAANPWGVVCSPDGKYICVAHSATHEVSLIDQAALLAKLSKVPRRDESKLSDDEYEALPENPANDLSFLGGIRQRIKLKGNGPRGVAIVNGNLYAAEYFSGSIAVIPLAGTEHAAQSLPLGPTQPMTPERQGEMLFNDAVTMCFQQWQSCSSCHPDGRMDAVNWDLLNDGIGNPKSTRSLVYCAETPPVMARGVRANAAVAVRTGMKFIQFMEPTEEKANPVYRYIQSLRPVPSPYLLNGELSPDAEHGKAIFERAFCSECHSGPHYTDLKLHKVGTGDGMESGATYKTPLLNEVWRTAPYLHDGRAATLEEVLTKFNPHDEHGNTSDLSPGERADLVEYLKSL